MLFSRVSCQSGYFSYLRFTCTLAFSGFSTFSRHWKKIVTMQKKTAKKLCVRFWAVCRTYTEKLQSHGWKAMVMCFSWISRRVHKGHDQQCTQRTFNGVHNYFTSWFSFENRWVIFINVLSTVHFYRFLIHTRIKVEMMSHALLPYWFRLCGYMARCVFKSFAHVSLVDGNNRCKASDGPRGILWVLEIFNSKPFLGRKIF